MFRRPIRSAFPVVANKDRWNRQKERLIAFYKNSHKQPP